jgi:hypothetical protein
VAKHKVDPQHRMLELLSEVLAIAHTLAPAAPAARTGTPRGARGGIYPHQSKYNPWRAYVWDTKLRRSVYVGAFPSKVKARAAQRAYSAGAPVVEGTKAALRVVAGAA